jgi:hypothetical protein
MFKDLLKNMFAVGNNLKGMLYNLNRIYTKYVLNHVEKFYSQTIAPFYLQH